MYRALLVFASYLVGTFPTARLLVPGITARGSGNPGASNAYRLAGPATAAMVLLGDAGKGVLAAAAGYVAGGRALAFACGLAALAGHCFPPRRGRTKAKGGKGVATAAGMIVVVAPTIAALAGVTWLAVARTTGAASLASLTAAASVPLAAALAGRPGWEVTALAAAATVIAVRHRSNVKDLVRGEERSLR